MQWIAMGLSTSRGKCGHIVGHIRFRSSEAASLVTMALLSPLMEMGILFSKLMNQAADAYKSVDGRAKLHSVLQLNREDGATAG